MPRSTKSEQTKRGQKRARASPEKEDVEEASDSSSPVASAVSAKQPPAKKKTGSKKPENEDKEEAVKASESAATAASSAAAAAAEPDAEKPKTSGKAMPRRRISREHEKLEQKYLVNPEDEIDDDGNADMFVDKDLEPHKTIALFSQNDFWVVAQEKILKQYGMTFETNQSRIEGELAAKAAVESAVLAISAKQKQEENGTSK